MRGLQMKAFDKWQRKHENSKSSGVIRLLAQLWLCVPQMTEKPCNSHRAKFLSLGAEDFPRGWGSFWCAGGAQSTPASGRAAAGPHSCAPTPSTYLPKLRLRSWALLFCWKWDLFCFFFFFTKNKRGKWENVDSRHSEDHNVDLLLNLVPVFVKNKQDKTKRSYWSV